MDIAIGVGIAYIVASSVGLVLNCMTIRAIYAHGMLRKSYSAMYILYLQPLITDVLFQLLHICYVAPAILSQNNHPLGRVVSYILDSGQSYCFFNNSLSQVSLAVNRFIVIVLMRMTFFTQFRTILISIGQHLLAVLITVSANYMFPCCLQVLEYTIFNFRTVLIPGIPNYSQYWIRLPVKIACSALPFVIYCIILISTRSIGRQANLKSGELTRRKKQELRFAAQFAIIAVIYTLSWVWFTLLPVTAISSSNWVFGLPALISMVNSTTNAVVFGINDRKKLCSICGPSSTLQGSSVQKSVQKVTHARPTLAH